MGNQASCHPSSSCSLYSASEPSPSDSPSACHGGSSSTSGTNSAVVHPCAVAKVLLLDGQVVHYTRPVKAIQVLLQHPRHCLCPAQSLRLLSNSPAPPPACLLPDDSLQLGHIYILVPLDTFRLFSHHAAAAATTVSSSSSAAAATTAPTRRRSLPSSSSSAASSRSLSSSSSAPRSSLSTSSWFSLSSPPSLPLPPPARRLSSDSRHLSLPRRASAPAPAPSYPVSIALPSALRRRSFELQRPYATSRGSSMRRCRSWRPRLQAITEVNSF